MPGTMFLDALEKKRKLATGYPLGEGRIVREQGPGLTHGANKNDLPNDKDLYRAPSLLDRAIGRLRSAVTPESHTNAQGKANIQARLDAESLDEGLSRDPKSIINQGVTKKGK